MQPNMETLGTNKMKVTKRQLKRIIREEKCKLHEVEYYGNPVGEALKNLVSELMALKDPEDRRFYIYDVIDQLETLASTG
jgi:hypothetical protein